MDRRHTTVTYWLGQVGKVVPLLFLLIFFIYPLGSILELSLFSDGIFDTSGFEAILSNSYYRETLWFTIWQATLSTILTLVLAIPGAHVFARYHFAGKSIILALATVPFVLPTVVVAAAFTALVGEDSTLNRTLIDIFQLDDAPIQLERSLTLIFIAHVFYNYAVAVRIISSFWGRQTDHIQEAAAMLGATPAQTFWRVTMWLLMPAILAAAALVFMFTFTSFGVILLLGGLQHATIEVEIYQQTLAFADFNTAGALSVIQLLATLLMMIVYTRLQTSTTTTLQYTNARPNPPRTGGAKLWVVVNLFVIIILIVLPLIALVERSLTVGQSGFSTTHYDALDENTRGSIIFVPPLEAVSNSLRFASWATVFAMILGTLAAYLLAQRGRLSRWLDPIFMLPLATSAVTLGFGFIITLDGDGWIDQWLINTFNLEESPLNLRNSFWIIPIAHTLVGLPFVVRSVLPALQSIPPALNESAAVLGAPPLQRWWRVEFPLISRSIVVGAVFAFTISMGEFGASVFVSRFDQPTIPIVIFRFLGQPGINNYGQALAMSVILMAVCVTGFILIERFNRENTRQW